MGMILILGPLLLFPIGFELSMYTVAVTTTVFIVYTVYRAQIYGAGAMKGYIYEYESNTLWEFYFTKGAQINTAENLKAQLQAQVRAKNKKLILKYLDKAKKGEKTWNWWTGEGVKILKMENPKVFKTKRSYTIYEYTDGAKKAKVRIINAFPGMLEMMSNLTNNIIEREVDKKVR